MMRPFIAFRLILIATIACGGCRVRAPIHVWSPPAITSTVGKRVVVSTVKGPDPYANEIKERLLRMSPSDQGRYTTFVDYQSLQDRSEIRLVSATDDEPNDLAIASVARRDGAAYLLRGEIIENRRAVPPSDSPGEAEEPSKTLTVSWSLKSLEDGSVGGGMPITVDSKEAIDTYPDLALSPNVDEVLINAAVRDTYTLFTPSVQREEVSIEIAYLLPGSAEVRRGSLAAMKGQWDEAERRWSEVVEKHPANIAALHNLAIAKAAGQDFSAAKQLARKAIRLQPTRLHQETLVWIETRQRNYHESFGLPDPPEGWFVSNGPSVNPTPKREPDPKAVRPAANLQSTPRH